MAEDAGNIVELIDEDGQTVKFEHVMTFEHEGEHFIALIPLSPIPDVGPDELMLMKVREEGDEDVYMPIEDRKKLDEVYETFLQIMEEADTEDGFEDEDGE